jgi:hypothetical protein
MIIRLYDNASGAELGTLTEEQLQFLIDNLEEETSDDQDYYLNPNTLELSCARPWEISRGSRSVGLARSSQLRSTDFGWQ